MKTCKKCGVCKPKAEFQKRSQMKDGLCIYCKQCEKARDASRYIATREVHLVRVKEWHETNRETSLLRKRNWRLQNRHLARKYAAARRGIKKQATPAWANKEKIDEYYFAADFLSMVTGVWYHVDHVVPLKGKTVCGLHWEGNMQVLLGVENLSKHNRFWPDMSC